MELIDYLKKEPRARERKNKNRAIANMLIQQYSLFTSDNMTKESLTDMVAEVLLLDRKWRLLLRENPDLRGTDYSDKQILEEKAILNLGYEPNYESNIAKLKTL